MHLKRSGDLVLLLLWITSVLNIMVESQNDILSDEYDQECQNELPQECGIPAVQPSILTRFRIVGGHVATPHSWPWQLSLQLNSHGGTEWKHYCGASVLSNCFAVTAAHCVAEFETEPGSLRLLSNIHDRSQNSWSKHAIQRVIIHPNYKGRDSEWDSDIALINVVTPFVFSRNVSAVCLPTASPKEGEEGAATGWGYAQNGGKLSTTLNQVQMPVITHSNCKQYYREVASFDKRFCAGFPKIGGKDTCQGDSGGPYVTRPQSTAYHLAGVTSVGTSCALINKPGIYTDVFQFRDWILSFINDNTSCKPNTKNKCEQSCKTVQGVDKCICHYPTFLKPDTKTCALDCGIHTDVASKPSWLVSLRNVGQPTVHQCSGVIIGNNWVLTTHRCVTKVSSMRQPSATRISSLISVTIGNDVISLIVCSSTTASCLLKTSTAIGLMGACLPTAPLENGTECAAYGWTRATSKVIARQCGKQSKLICTKPVDLDEPNCTGDHADFITCPSPAGGNREFLYGLVLNVCAENDGASQLVDVRKNMEWISKVVKTY